MWKRSKSIIQRLFILSKIFDLLVILCMICRLKSRKEKFFHFAPEMKIFYASFIILLLCIPVLPQFYNTGQAPASVKWSQINTTNFQIIYPDDFYHEANRVANLLEYMYSYIAADYVLKPEKISIILYNQSVLSNGYVAWAPRRSEWITTPPRESYSQDWCY